MDSIRVFKNRYYLDKFIGKGVQGVVFEAYDTLLKKKVAIKILNNGSPELEQQKMEIEIL